MQYLDLHSLVNFGPAKPNHQDQPFFLQTDSHLNDTAYEPIVQNLDVNESDPLAWRNTSKSAEERAQLLVDAMTFDEKADTVTGHVFPGALTWTGATEAIPRLKVPRVRYQDGPQGFRMNIHWGTSTSWPSILTFSQTWDEELVEEWGQKMGKEFKDKGAAVQLGPGMNIMRNGENGRDFEYMPGEDPHIGERLVAPLIKGIQSNGIMANMKHYINNEQETHRWGQSANIDERTQYEIYYPPFQAAIKAGVGSAMCSYNKVNHVQSCANNKTLNRDLRDIMGFEGFVMSDWGAVYDNPKYYIPSGCDQEQGSVLRHYTKKALSKDVEPKDLDKAVYRIVKSFIEFGLYEEELPDNFNANVTSKEHQDFARKAVEESTILLKNENASLPLQKKQGMSVLVLGNQAGNPTLHGTGSGQIGENYVYTPLEAICDELQVPRITAPLPFGKSCSSETGHCVTYLGLPRTNGKWLGEKEVEVDAEQAMAHEEIQEMLSFEFDTTIIFQGLSSGEGSDRTTLDWDQSVFKYLNMIKQPGTVIGCMISPGPILTTNMRKYADAIVLNVFPGQQYSSAIMNVLFGRANPAGRLTFTMPNIDNEQNKTKSQYPGDDNGWNSSYSEKHHFGYRWYDQYNVTPAFEFGHGLSYTSFKFETVAFDRSTRTVTVDVVNEGKMTGSQVVQVYVGYPETDKLTGGYRSPAVLRGFKKAKDLKPGEARTVEIPLTEQSFSYWDVSSASFKVDSGRYTIYVGDSSRNMVYSGYVDF